MSEHKPEADVDTGHDYDGIREFDNPLPRWWLITFYGAIVFGFGYWLHFHVLTSGRLPRAELDAELQRIETEEAARLAQLEAEGKGVTEKLLLSLVSDPQAVERGEAVFKQNCLSCHGDKGQGVVGPNLTDAYWIHGEKPMDIYKTVGAGVLDKGMPAWKPLLGINKVRDATVYVLTQRNKNLPGKAPQGITADGKPAP